MNTNEPLYYVWWKSEVTECEGHGKEKFSKAEAEKWRDWFNKNEKVARMHFRIESVEEIVESVKN